MPNLRTATPSYTNPIRWVLVYNDTDDDAPPFACMAAGDVDSQGRVKVTQPANDGQTAGLLFNGATAIPARTPGQGQRSWPSIAAYIPSGEETPVAGEVLGAVADSWYLSPRLAGFKCIGGSDSGLTNVMPLGYTFGPGIVQVRNDTEEDLPTHSVLGLQEPLTTPQEDLGRFMDHAAHSGGPPLARAVAVTLTSLPQDVSGPAVASGAVAVRLTLSRLDNDRFATPIDDDTLHLTNSSSAGALIVWRDDPAASGSVTGAANNGSGLVRVAAGTHGLATGAIVIVYNVAGTTEANGTWTVTVIDSTHLDLQASTYSHAWTSGGTWFLVSTAVTDVTETVDGGIEVVSPKHNLQTGDEVQITCVGGQENANTVAQVTVIDADTFTLDGVAWGDEFPVTIAGIPVTYLGVTVTYSGAYTSGGLVTKQIWSVVILPTTVAGITSITCDPVTGFLTATYSDGLPYADDESALVPDSDGSTITFNLASGSHHKVTLGGNRTLAISNPASNPVFRVILQQDGTGSRTVTWFSGIRWSAGTAPTLTTTAGKIDVFDFEYLGAGSYLNTGSKQNL